MKQTKNEYYLQPQFDNAKSFYNKALIIADGDTLILKSYNTNILKLDRTTNKIIFLTKNKDHYTHTTNRHINEFLKQTHGNYETLTKKQILKSANII